MNKITYTNHSKNNKSHSIENGAAPRSNGGAASNHFIDNRPHTVAQRRLQQLANNHLSHPYQHKEMGEEELLQGKFKTLQKKVGPKPNRRPNNTGLPDNLKMGIENLSGYSMDDVKVHRNSDRPAQLNAHAYAQGTQIHLGPGQEKHLPHEAWHVAQQKQGRVKPTLQMKGNVAVNDDAGLEKEADQLGGLALINNKEFSNQTQGQNYAYQAQCVTMQFYGKNTTVIFKQVDKNIHELVKSRDISDQVEVDLAADGFASKYETEEIHELGGDYRVTEMVDTVVVVAHGSALGKFAGKEPELIARTLKEKHGVKPGTTIHLEACYSGKYDPKNKQESVVAKFGQEMDKGQKEKFTTISANPGVEIFLKGIFGSVFLKMGRTDMIFKLFIHELKENDTAFMNSVIGILSPLTKLSKKSAEDIFNILNKECNKPIIFNSIYQENLESSHPQKISKIFNKQVTKKMSISWEAYILALIHADTAFEQGYNPQSTDAKAIFETAIENIKDSFEQHKMRIKQQLDDHMEEMFKHEDKKAIKEEN